MSARTKMHHTDLQKDHYKIIIVTPTTEKVSYISTKNIEKIEAFLEKYAEIEDDSPISWEKLAKERIEKYKRAGLALRGMRYRENMSQKELAKRSGVSQNEISKIENGKRTVGVNVAKRLAKALNFDYRLLLDP